jgi:hypothetical protein
LLDELKAEENSGFKASMSLDGSKREEKQSDRYEEEFEEIDEDLPDQDIDGSAGNFNR